jgi:tetratricopeptide (TPR) repeat protein
MARLVLVFRWGKAGSVVVRSALMRMGVTRVLVVTAVCVIALAGCDTSTKISSLWNKGDTAEQATGSTADTETTGSVVVPPAEPGPSGELAAPLAKPGLLGDDPNDELSLGKKYFRSNNFGLAERHFRKAVETHPRDAEGWMGLAASYDRLHRFDLADRAYSEAIRIVGATPEILNNQGFSYMLRGDYARARKKLEDAQAKDPGNPYVEANMKLLQDSSLKGKAVQ